MKAVRRLLSAVAVVMVVATGQTETAAASGPTHSSAVAVAPDGQTVWVVNPDSNTVAKIGANSLTRLDEFAVGSNPRTLAVLGTQYVYVADQNDDTVVRLDQHDGSSLTHQMPYGCAPYGVAAAPDGTRVYVTCQHTDTVVAFDANFVVLGTVSVLSNPRGIAVSADATRVYVTHFLTREPSNTAHVSEIDATTCSVARVFDIPADTTICETINSAPGVANLISAIALTPPDSPAGVANQVWVAGTRENVIGKGLFKRSNYFKGRPGTERFAFPFSGFPGDDTASRRRNIFKPSFHDIIRSFVAKIDLGSGQVVGFADIKGANAPEGIEFSADGTLVYTIDRTSNRFAIFNTERSGIINDDPPNHTPGHCTSNAFDTTSENPLLAGLAHPIEVELRSDDPAPLEVAGEVGGTAMTGLDYDVATNSMRAISDGIGTTPIGLALSPDGQRLYTASFLARAVTVVDVRPESFRCANPETRACSSPLDCPQNGPGICGNSVHGGAIKTCTDDNDCDPGIRCTRNSKCLPQIIGVVDSTGQDPLPAELLDGKILFSTSARDSSVPNGIGLARPVPPANYLAPDAMAEPGTVVSTSHDAEYLACTSCHAEQGNDGRTWDNSQFGASLRNTQDLRGRASLAPGTCGNNAADPGKVGQPCTYDAACGTGSPMMACRANPAFVPMSNPAVAANSERFFNPMGTIHWNADRDEVEDFEQAFRSLQGAGDCDGNEHLAEGCIGALVMRSHTTDPVDVSDDLGAPNRAIHGQSGIAGIRLTHMADFVYSESTYVRNPNTGASGENISLAARRGRAIFNDARVGCATCHNGPSADNQLFTDKRPLQPGESGFDPDTPASGTNNPYLRHNVGTANIFDLTDPNTIASQSAFANSFLPLPGHRGQLTAYLTPTLVDVWNTAPYLHDGSAATLMDVIRPCNSRFEDCNDPTAGRNIDDRHGRTSFLTHDQLADLEAFLKAPHGPIGSGPLQAQLEVTSAAMSAPEFGFTFPIPIAGAKIGVTFDPATHHIIINGADFPPGLFDTKLAGIATFDIDDKVFTGTIDSAGNLSVPDFSMVVTVLHTSLPYTFHLQTGTVTLDTFMLTGAPLNSADGSFSLVAIEDGLPVPILGQPTDTEFQLAGRFTTLPLIVARTGTISGVVRDAAGHPVAGAHVALRRGTRRNAITSSDGQFLFDQLRLGVYVLRVSKPGVGRDRKQIVVNADSPARDVDSLLH